MRKSTQPTRPYRLFVSYVREDSDYLRAFLSHAATLSRTNLIDIWYDDRLQAGEQWDPEIRKQLSQADIVVLLVSSDFLYSDYINTTELPMTLAMQDAGELIVFMPVLIRNAFFEIDRLGNYNMFPKSEQGELKPVNRWQPWEDDAWKQVVERIYQGIQQYEQQNGTN